MTSLLLLGIGNPGLKYENTRHNLGTLILWELIKFYEPSFDKNNYPIGFKFCVDSQEILALYNISYVNTTGSALGKQMNNNHIKPHQLVVFHDDLNLNIGEWKLKFSCGTGGHNGLKSIKKMLLDKDFYKIGCGINHPGSPDLVSDYVLGEIDKKTKESIPKIVDEIIKLKILENLLIKNIKNLQ